MAHHKLLITYHQWTFVSEINAESIYTASRPITTLPPFTTEVCCFFELLTIWSCLSLNNLSCCGVLLSQMHCRIPNPSQLWNFPPAPSKGALVDFSSAPAASVHSCSVERCDSCPVHSFYILSSSITSGSHFSHFWVSEAQAILSGCSLWLVKWRSWIIITFPSVKCCSPNITDEPRKNIVKQYTGFAAAMADHSVITQ